MRFSATARNPCFANRRTSPRGGPRTTPAPPTETTDEARCKNHVSFLPPLLARPSRMVWRRSVRKLPSFEGHAVWFAPHAHTGGVLRRTTRPPLFSPQPLLLRLRQDGACRRRVSGVDSSQLRWALRKTLSQEG